MDSIPYSEVRAHLSETLRQLEVREEPVYISRRGELAGVLMSVAQYQRLAGGAGSDFWTAVCTWREQNAEWLASAEAEEDPFANVRDRSPDGGRPPFTFDDPDISEASKDSTEAR